MMSQNAVSQSPRTSQSVAEDVNKLTEQIDTLQTLTSSAGLVGAALGSVLGIVFGPLAFVSGAALGAAAVGGLAAYTAKRKNELQKEIALLQEAGGITSSDAEGLKSKLDLIHTDASKPVTDPSANTSSVGEPASHDNAGGS